MIDSPDLQVGVREKGRSARGRTGGAAKSADRENAGDFHDDVNRRDDSEIGAVAPDFLHRMAPCP